MTTAMMTPILGALDHVGYDYLNILGGAVFDVCVRFLHENPYRRVGLLCSRLGTPCDALTRGQSLYTFELFPDDIVALNSRVLARLGIRVLTVYDALNDNRNLESSIRSAHEAGMQVNAMITYTLSPVHTDAYYVERAVELKALKSAFISIKDPTGPPGAGAHAVSCGRRGCRDHPMQPHHCQSDSPRGLQTPSQQASATAIRRSSSPTALRCLPPKTSTRASFWAVTASITRPRRKCPAISPGSPNARASRAARWRNTILLCTSTRYPAQISNRARN